MQAASISFCPSCGNDSEFPLDDITGWCRDCSTTNVIKTAAPNANVNASVKICVRCGQSFNSEKSEFICLKCKTEEWANEIEQLMGTGNISFTKAELLLAKSNQAYCLACGAVIARGTKGRHMFHMDITHPICKSAGRRVKHLRLNKGMTREEAITTVLGELSINDQTV